MPFVLDASTTLAWYFEDEASEYADRILLRMRDGGALVPSVWPLEVANGLLAAQRRGRLSSAAVGRVTELAINLPVTVHGVTPGLALGAIMEVARSQGLTAYDASYLELAMRQDVPLATQDSELRKAAVQAGVALVE